MQALSTLLLYTRFQWDRGPGDEAKIIKEFELWSLTKFDYLAIQIESVELGRIYYTPPDTQKGVVQLQAGLHAEVWVTTKEKSMSVACVNIEVIDILAIVSKQK